MNATALLQATVGDVFGALLAHRPEWATELGDHRYDDRLDDRSDSGLAEEARALTDAAARLDELDAAALDADHATDLAMLQALVRRRLLEIDVLREHRWNPLVYTVGDALYPLLVRDPRPAAVRLDALASRLGAVPWVVDAALRQLDDMPRVHVETALVQTAGARALATEQLHRLAAEEPAMCDRVTVAQAAAVAALDRFEAHLQSQLARSDGEFRVGPDAFAAKLRLALHSHRTPDEVLAAARDHLAEVHESLYEVARRHAGGPGVVARGDRHALVREVLDEAAADHPDDATIVALAGDLLAECAQFVRDHDLLTLPEQPVELQVMPEFRRGVAVAYCDPPPPLEEPAGPSFFAIAPTPADWPDERRVSFYREYNAAMVRNLTVHEAMPGHVVQLALARRCTGPTVVRRAVLTGTFVEGWAVYAEEIMAEAGFGGDALRLQQLKMQLRSTINAILDAGVHVAGMSEPEALELMTRDGFQEEGEAHGKWRRACLTSVQLSTYFVGYLDVRDAVRAAPAGLSLRQIHDAVLAHGSPPPRQIPRLEGW